MLSWARYGKSRERPEKASKIDRSFSLGRITLLPLLDLRHRRYQRSDCLAYFLPDNVEPAVPRHSTVGAAHTAGSVSLFRDVTVFVKLTWMSGRAG